MTEKRFTDIEVGADTGRVRLFNGLDFYEYSPSELLQLLNHLHEENQLKFEILEAFIRGMEDEKGIDPTNKEFQCRMNHTIKVLKQLKQDFENPNEFKRLKEERQE